MPFTATRAFLAAATVLAPLAVAPTASSATPAIKFTGWQADYQGTTVPDEPVTAAKLNGEYITITNTTSTARPIGGYRVSDDGAKHVYVIPAGFKLGPKQSVILRSGQGGNSATTLYWGQFVKGAKPVSRNSYVWNNTGDTATLRSNTGAMLHTCTYTKTKSGFKAC